MGHRPPRQQGGHAPGQAAWLPSRPGCPLPAVDMRDSRERAGGGSGDSWRYLDFRTHKSAVGVPG